MGKFSAAATARDIAESRTTLTKLAVASHQLGIKMLGLSVGLAVMLAGTVLGGLMLAGYVQLPSMAQAEIQQAGFPIMCLCGLAAGGAFYLLIVHWMAKVQVSITRERLDAAIRDTAEAWRRLLVPEPHPQAR